MKIAAPLGTVGGTNACLGAEATWGFPQEVCFSGTEYHRKGKALEGVVICFSSLCSRVLSPKEARISGRVDHRSVMVMSCSVV